MRCEEVRPLLSAGLDGELEPDGAAKMQAHLTSCALCAAEREALSTTVRLLRAIPESDPPAELRRRIGVTLLEIERRSDRRWLGLSWLARPQSAGWAWGAALGTVAATFGLMTTRGPAPVPPLVGVQSPPAAAVPAPQTTVTPRASETIRHQVAANSERKQADKDRDVAPRMMPAPAAPTTVVATATVPVPTRAVKPAPAASRIVPGPSSPPRRRGVQTVRRPSPPAPQPRSVPAPSPAPGSGRQDSTGRDMPLVVRSEQDPMPVLPPSDPPGAEHRSGTAGMTQMASGMTEPPAPAASSDDLVELRRRLLDRPIHMPSLGELKPSSSMPSGRDGWIRF